MPWSQLLPPKHQQHDAWGVREIYNESLLAKVLPGGDADGADAVDLERRASE